MKEVRLAYGRDGIVARVPDDAVVVTATDLPGLADEAGAVLEALRTPVAGPGLSGLVRDSGASACARNGGGTAPRVAVVFPDLTRPMPNRTVLPPLLAELERSGAGPERVDLLCATGTHRLATPEEMVELVGPDIAARYTIHQHRADAPEEHVEVGEVDRAPIRIDRRYVEADVRILTGFVEPHFFAGFSGGPKGACPGLAALETILEAHSPARIVDPRATWLLTEGNPVHDFVRAAVALTPPALSVDVAINQQRELTAVFAGPLPAGHAAACRFVERTSVQIGGRALRRRPQHQRRVSPRPQPVPGGERHGGGASASCGPAGRSSWRRSARTAPRTGAPSPGCWPRRPTPRPSTARAGHRRPTGGRPRCSAVSCVTPMSGSTPGG